MATEASDVNESTPLLRSVVGPTHNGRPPATRTAGSTSSSSTRLDLKEIDARFKRWIDHIVRKRSADVSPLERDVQFILSVFQQTEQDIDIVQAGGKHGQLRWPEHDGYISESDFQRQVTFVKRSIAQGLHPEMIQTGSSGSYFVRSYDYDALTNRGDAAEPSTRQGRDHSVVAVHKAFDEEPYGDLNPKRVFLRRYLWWAMGRPCLISGFSYLAEVGASLLDDRLRLGMVPSTRLVWLSSKQFSYPESARRKGVYPEKPGSYQQFLTGYVNASAFLRSHPWPSRPRSLLEQDLRAENTAHGRAKARARKGRGAATKKSVGRKCWSMLTSVNCLAPIGFTPDEDLRKPAKRPTDAERREDEQTRGFEWTPDLMNDFRLELEKLVCFDYLIRNTDRGLDNFMIRILEPTESKASTSSQPPRRRLVLAAIDNSLAFPWKHPAGIRSYPFGWLYLPTDLIGGPFSAQTRAAFLPCLSSAVWWQQTRGELEALFRKDDNFDSKKFEGQMQVLRGQGWNLLESLRNEDEGPLELCARAKRFVPQRDEVVEVNSLVARTEVLMPLTPSAVSIKATVIDVARQRAATTAAKPSASTPSASIAMPNSDSSKRPQNINGADVTPRSLPEQSNGRGGSTDDNRPQWGIQSVIDNVNHRQPDEPTSPVAHVDLSQSHVDETAHTQQMRTAMTSPPPESPGDAALGRAYRRGTLGIDVLAQIDKSAAKARRPGLRKSITRGVSATRVPSRRLNSFAVATRVSRDGALQENDDDANERNMLASVASLDNFGPGPSAPSTGRRRRMGSVSDAWGNLAALNHVTQGHGREAEHERVRVLTETIETDDGVAWQTWLGLQ